MTKVQSKVKKDVTDATSVESGSQTNRPLKSFRDGDVTASVWSRVVTKLEPRTFYSISIERSYQNAKGEWKYTNFYSPADDKKIFNVWQQAVEFIDEEKRQDAA